MPVSKRRVKQVRVRNRSNEGTPYLLRLSHADRSHSIDHSRYVTLSDAREHALIYVQSFATAPTPMIAEVYKGCERVAVFEPLEAL